MHIPVGKKVVHIGWTIGFLDDDEPMDEEMVDFGQVVMALISHAHQIAAGQTIEPLVIQAYGSSITRDDPRMTQERFVARQTDGLFPNGED